MISCIRTCIYHFSENSLGGRVFYYFLIYKDIKKSLNVNMVWIWKGLLLNFLYVQVGENVTISNQGILFNMRYKSQRV